MSATAISNLCMHSHALYCYYFLFCRDCVQFIEFAKLLDYQGSVFSKNHLRARWIDHNSLRTAQQFSNCAARVLKWVSRRHSHACDAALAQSAVAGSHCCPEKMHAEGRKSTVQQCMATTSTQSRY